MTRQKTASAASAPLADFVASVIESLRPRLLDLTRRNPLINTRRSAKSNAHIWVVDELPDVLKHRLSLGEAMRFAALPPLDSAPLDEKTEAFDAALAVARLTDTPYLAELDSQGDQHEDFDAERAAERRLRDRVRSILGLPPFSPKQEMTLEAHAKLNGIASNFELPQPDQQHADGRHTDELIQTLLLPDDLDRKMSALIDKGREWRQETGIGVFRAAFGFLDWADVKNGDKGFSPLMMLEIEITKRKAKGGSEYWVESLGEPAQRNGVLAVKLRNDFGIELPEFEGGSLEEYFQKVSAIAPASIRWSVRRQIAFGVFPSARMAMFEDLDTQRNDFSANPVVRSLLAGSQEKESTPFADEYETDRPEIEKKVPVLVNDSDSSQFSALVDVMSGCNLALEGPPGSGKSQTIVNAIACAISEGKKVLFVASKAAALEVVKARLAEAGLGEFVLSLQAERSSREQVVKSLRERLEMERDPPPHDLDGRIREAKEVRASLSGYIDLVSSQFGETGFTVYEVLGKSIATSNRLQNAPAALQTPGPAKLPIDRKQTESLRRIGIGLEKAWRDAEAAPDFWRGSELPVFDRLSLESVCRQAKWAASLFVDARNSRQQLERFGLDGDLSTEQDDLRAILCSLEAIDGKAEPADVRRAIKNGALVALQEFRDGLQSYRDHKAAIAQACMSPISAAMAERLRSAHKLCQRYKIQALDLPLLRRKRDAMEERLDSYRATEAIVRPYINAFPREAQRPLAQLATANDFIAQWPPEILRARHDALQDHALLLSVKRLCEAGRNLQARQRALEPVIVTSSNIDGSTFRDDCGILRGANILSVFSPAFRSAKRRYQAVTRRSKFERQSACRDLQDLADWREAERKLSGEMESLGVFGSHHRGADTDFSLFDRLADFYQEIERSYPGLANRDLRDFLWKADIDQLASIPAIDGAFSTTTIGDLQDRIVADTTRLALFDRICTELSALVADLRSPTATPVGALPELADRVDQAIELGAPLAVSTPAREVLGSRFNGANTGIDVVEFVLEASKAVQSAGALAGDVIGLLESGEVAQCRAALDIVLAAEKTAWDALEALAESAHISTDAFVGPGDLPAMAARLIAASEDFDGLRAHAAFAAAKREFEATGFGWIVSTLTEQDCRLNDLPALIEAVAARRLVIELYELHGAALSRFDGARLDDLRTRFASLDREIMSLNRRMLRSKLRGEATPPAGIAEGPKSGLTELALIRHQASLQKRHAPVRDLMKRSGRALRELKPCWMMSPLAVAQYVPAKQEPFDLIIIDEASQMTPEEAIGALARGRQAMIVGDVNQLPPSNYFRRMLDGGGVDGGGDGAVCEESILEMANAAFRPARRLRWHYRSRHSSLIQFSNHFVYDGKLIVFPSSEEQRPSMGVSLQSTAGVYQSGANPDEAKAMIKAALDHMRFDKKRSLGLVVMNQTQRELLRQEWDFALANDREAQDYVGYWAEKNGGLEEFFIKNLENVQGDERDVIFIGTVYGPEHPGGPVMQRFGPINGVTGKRRLNVLFTRAKEQIITFSSMTAADVRADENGNPGVYLMKRWLEYSQTRQIEGGRLVGREPDSDFERYVAEQIRSMGCEPVPQVGVKGFWIDIGVRHQEWTHGFLLGVECDGATYHSSKSARDRDRLRQEVLERQGWHLHRIWSTDWFNDPRKEAQRLRIAIEARLKALRLTERTPQLQSIRPVSDREVDPAAQMTAIKRPSQARGELARELDSLPASTTVAKGTDDGGVAIGDRVRVRYINGTKSTLQFTLSKVAHAPDQGLVRDTSPIGRAVIGAEVGDEIEVLDGSYIRTAIVEKVTKNSGPSSSSQAAFLGE